MDNSNVGQAPQQRVAISSGGVLYFTESLDQTTLKPGLYRPTLINIGQWVPGYKPIAVTNDKPLEVDSTVTDVLKELEEFLRRRPLFKKMQFAHKRGYMFHGAPGCGKSSALRLLEERFVTEFGGIVLFWNQDVDLDVFYNHLRGLDPDRPIMVVCEDIDNNINDFEVNLLEFLDGQHGLDNFVMVATTNNLAAIPSRIKDRPSRIDRVIEIKKPDASARYRYLRQIGVEDGHARAIADHTDGMSMAHVKEAVVATVLLGQDLDDVVKRLESADMGPRVGS